MTELNDDLKKRIWLHIHGELDEQADEELCTLAFEDEAIDRAIQERRNLDSLLTEAIGNRNAVGTKSHDIESSEILKEEPHQGKILPFPIGVRMARVAAVFAILLCSVYVVIPRDDLRWSEPPIVLLGQTRAGDTTSKENMLNQSSIRSACSDLRNVINTAYKDSMGENGQRWDLRLTVTEHVKCTFEVRVDAQAIENKDLTMMERRRYQSVSEFEADLEDLSKTMVSTLKSDEP